MLTVDKKQGAYSCPPTTAATDATIPQRRSIGVLVDVDFYSNILYYSLDVMYPNLKSKVAYNY